MENEYTEDLFEEEPTAEEIIFAYNLEIKEALDKKQFQLAETLTKKLDDYLVFLAAEDNHE